MYFNYFDELINQLHFNTLFFIYFAGCNYFVNFGENCVISKPNSSNNPIKVKLS